MTTVLFTVSSCFSILNVATTPPHLPPDYTPSGRSSHLFPSRVRASQACFQPSALPGSLSRLEGPEGHTLCSLPNLGHRETSRPHEHKGLLCPMPSPCLGHGLATRHRASQSSACRGQFGFHTLPTTPGTKRAHRCQEGPRAHAVRQAPAWADGARHGHAGKVFLSSRKSCPKPDARH